MRFSSALALDRYGDEYVLTAYSGDGVLSEGRGKSISEAFASASEKSGGNLFYGTAEAFFIGSGASGKKELAELAEYALSDSDIRLSVPVALCPCAAVKAYSEELVTELSEHSETPLSALIESVLAKYSKKKPSEFNIGERELAK